MNQQAMPSALSLMTSPVWGLKTSTPFTFTRILPSFSLKSMSGSPKMTNRLPLPVFFEIVRHVQVRVHPSLEHRDAAQLIELRRVCLVVEGAGYQYVEPGVASLAGSG